MASALIASAVRVTEGATTSTSKWAEELPILPHYGELIFGIIAFAILYVVVAKKVVPRLEEIYTERAAAIEGGIEKAEKAQAEASAALEEYQQQLAEGRAEASRLRAEATAQGATIIAEMREQAQAQADRILAVAQTQIDAERQQAVLSLRSEVGALASELASRIVGEALTDDARQQRVIDRFLAELDATQSVPSSGQGV